MIRKVFIFVFHLVHMERKILWLLWLWDMYVCMLCLSLCVCVCVHMYIGTHMEA